ncbi:MAG: hypothetical protein ACK4KX_03250 [Parvibaculum sp.]|uniref:hypothetical protein n=1 Tax=Parvibaculum sp. TaxID=2024848 RepID=UPI00391B2FF7
MSNRSVQNFPSGEVRVYEWTDGDEPRIVDFTRAPGDMRKESMIGKRESELPAPFEAAAENE